jgi:YVTN family beta-propeller protein
MRRRSARPTVLARVRTVALAGSALLLAGLATPVPALAVPAPNWSGRFAYANGGGFSFFDVAAGSDNGGVSGDGQQIVFDDRAATAYIGDTSSDTVRVVDVASNALRRTITLGATPSSLALSPDGDTLWVGTATGLLPVATRTGVVGGARYNAAVSDFVLSADGGTAYLATPTQGVVILDLDSGTVTATVSVSPAPNKIAISPDGAAVYALATGVGGQVSKISTSTHTVTAGPAAAGTFPLDFAVNPNGSELYVADFNFGTAASLQVLSLSTLATTDTIPAGGGQRAVTVSPDGRTIAVLAPNANQIEIIDAATHTVLQEPTLTGGAPAVYLPDVAPRAAFTASAENVGAATSFDASSSTVFPGVIGTYSWNFGDGSTRTTTTPQTQHTYARAGTYRVTLRETTLAGSTVGTAQYFGRQALVTGSATARTVRSVTVAGPPTTVSSPKDRTVDIGADASFTSRADGGPAPTVRWQRSTDGGGTWRDVPGATATTLTLTSVRAADDGLLVRAIFTNASGSLASEPAALHVRGGASPSSPAGADGSPVPSSGDATSATGAAVRAPLLLGLGLLVAGGLALALGKRRRTGQ